MMRTRMLALTLAGLLVVPTMAVENEPPVTQDPVITVEDAAANAAALALEYGGATSVQYAVWDDGKITLTGHNGVYSKTENRVLTDDTLYGIGSVSKVYTAAAVMKLVDGGKVDLDKSVTTYLPDFKMADPRYQDITVGMLLDHSSGLLGSTMPSAFLFGDPKNRAAVDELLARLETQMLKADPGAFSVYCNDGFTLAQLVVEAVCGQSLDLFLRESFYAPMGLTDTFAPADDFDRARLAKTCIGEDTRATPAENLAVLGTGGIYATAADLAAFGGALYAGGVLTEASLDAMSAPAYEKGLWPADTEDQLGYGLGWDTVHYYPFAYSDIQALVKGGDTQLYHAGLLVLPEYDLSVAVLSSGGVSIYNEAAAARIAIRILEEKGVTVDDAPRALEAQATAPMPKELTEQSGYYTSSALPAQIDIAEAGVLTVTTAYGSQEFTYRADGTFMDESNRVAVQPVRLENGEVYLWQKTYQDLPDLIGLPTSSYAYQKTAPNPVDPAVQAAWEAREGRLYLSLTEDYTSQVYAMALPMAGIAVAGSAAGYMSFNRMVDADHSEGVAQIPSTAGRDWQNLTMTYDEAGREYLGVMGATYQNVTDVPALWAGEGAYATILEGGDNRWYRAGSAAGKTMAVTLPERGAFYVYTAEGVPVAGSWTWGDTQVVLPDDGYILFSGEAEQRFYLSFNQ